MKSVAVDRIVLYGFFYVHSTNKKKKRFSFGYLQIKFCILYFWKEQSETIFFVRASLMDYMEREITLRSTAFRERTING